MIVQLFIINLINLKKKRKIFVLVKIQFSLDDDFDLDVEEKNPKIHSKVLGAKYLKKPKKGKTIQTDNSNVNLIKNYNDYIYV